MDGITLEDLRLHLGEELCDLQSLSDGNLFCRVDITDKLIDTEVKVTLYVGDWLTYEIGNLQYSGTNKINRIILIVGVLSGFILIGWCYSLLY